ncbi:ABC transporter ATP-binding protein [Desulfosarcina sp. OttesenSCG-928-A07]|nr:ABC transporter ATP-binding protein [Desulfosarcina sp. OttesenSCG-928-G17]MDL2328443.1 ABC transporter ATP-binding protein [Desulfosarcina sp. OttesenSCG-928-A07]
MIEVRHLTKQFGHHLAVNDISFSVEKREILAFLGPNGAGKSTTMRMITGFFPPTGGTVIIDGNDIRTDSLAARQKMGYLPENAPVYPDMRVTAYLNFCAEIRGLTGRSRRDRVAETLERCFLTHVRDQTVSTLSKGYKQRVCFAQSILHDPDYLILDEPTDGLDPNQKHEVRQMIREMSPSKAIIFSTHILDEVETVCSRAIIIADGKVVADDTPGGLKRRSSLHGTILLTAAGPLPDDICPYFEKITGVSQVAIVDTEQGRFTLRIFPDDPETSCINRILTAANWKNIDILSVSVEEGRLDEVFRQITADPEDA